MPWWPGWVPVRIVVWLASVTDGSDRDRPVPQAGSHGQQPGQVGCLARRHHVVEHVGVGAVPQEADHVLGRFAVVEQLGQHLAVLAGQHGVVARGTGRAHTVGGGLGAQQGEHRGRHVDEAARAGDEPLRLHAGARQHERGPHLHDAERAVLAPLAALVLPVVRGRVQAQDVRCGRVVEQLGDVLVGVGVRLLGAAGPAVVELVDQRREPVGRRVAQGVAALDQGLDEAPRRPAVPVGIGRRARLTTEAHPPVDRPHVVPLVVGGDDEVDDGLEGGVEQRVGGSPHPAGIGYLVPGRTRRAAWRRGVVAPSHGHGRTLTDAHYPGFRPRERPLPRPLPRSEQ
jgi:hypothetical protein